MKQNDIRLHQVKGVRVEYINVCVLYILLLLITKEEHIKNNLRIVAAVGRLTRSDQTTSKAVSWTCAEKVVSYTPCFHAPHLTLRKIAI